MSISGEDITVLEMGPSNEEYSDTLVRLGVTPEEVDTLVKSYNEDGNFQFLQNNDQDSA